MRPPAPAKITIKFADARKGIHVSK